jgi:hypothetical protein
VLDRVRLLVLSGRSTANCDQCLAGSVRHQMKMEVALCWQPPEILWGVPVN